MKRCFLALCPLLSIVVLGSPGLAETSAEEVAEQMRAVNVQRLILTNGCYHCDLAGADLSGAHLIGADLRETTLAGANLSWSNLEGADLTQANLADANLTGAFLTNASLAYTNLDNVNFAQAQLYYVDVAGASIDLEICSMACMRCTAHDSSNELSRHEWAFCRVLFLKKASISI